MYIQAAFRRRGVAIYTHVEARLVYLIVGRLRRVCAICVGYERERSEFEDLVDGSAADLVDADVGDIL